MTHGVPSMTQQCPLLQAAWIAGKEQLHTGALEQAEIVWSGLPLEVHGHTLDQVGSGVGGIPLRMVLCDHLLRVLTEPNTEVDESPLRLQEVSLGKFRRFHMLLRPSAGNEGAFMALMAALARDVIDQEAQPLSLAPGEGPLIVEAMESLLMALMPLAAATSKLAAEVKEAIKQAGVELRKVQAQFREAGKPKDAKSARPRRVGILRK